MQALPIPGFTVKESSKYLGVRRENVYAWIREGKVNAEIDICNQYRIPYAELHRILQERDNKPRRV
jgi:excisionase family DNA binding protein